MTINEEYIEMKMLLRNLHRLAKGCLIGVEGNNPKLEEVIDLIEQWGKENYK